ncbi:methyltransferase cognate corrinoid protein [Desulfosporosinus orientis DSM 765]|uniref:Methyltransferase cognate corrinoid protein n=1 Tax=Desulfosporosinus orientis (strain ATCC 19365 / DSM 765 / NCIMB 8382 / VKM B-1628 / Singapore I) TaxID=768706 RepID=G7WH82_DESOD|nr:corrinoid protein [Desulfosporosinus orientis]AET69590.1 methyltransferase cognate corrinoid protein [Desulfosporosinus orientis DSM 765]
MANDEILQKIIEGVREGDAAQVPEWTKKAIAAGIEPLVVINEGLTKGIQAVGALFANGTYFLPDLLLGAKAMDAGIKVIEPLMAGQKREFLGRVLMGTVEGDLHEIGKNIVIMMLKTAGFEVRDIGIDVPAKKFIEQTLEFKPDIIGISALLTTTVGRQKEIIELLQEEGLRDKVKVMIGGAPINQNWADTIGADGYAEDASVAVEVAKRLLGA